MAAVLTENPIDALDSATAVTDAAPGADLLLRRIDEADVMSELGIWLAGLESFIATGYQLFGDPAGAKSGQDTTREFRLTRSVLMRCSMLNSRLVSLHIFSSTDKGLAGKTPAGPVLRISAKEHDDFDASLRDVIVLNDSLIGAEKLGFGEWRSWSNMLKQRFDALSAVHKLIRYAEESGERYLPDRLNEVVRGGGTINLEHAELCLLLPRFARILKWLSVVGRMLESDEPLKPALIIFARVNEQVFELINYINNRLARFQDVEAELFSSLDAAAYTASIELRKVYSQELTGVSALRPATSIHARMETAHSVLNESFQQIVADFARRIAPELDVFALFPNFQQKIEQSRLLRQNLWTILQLAVVAEKRPEKRQVESLNEAIREFMADSVRFLFYKDTETFERFVEEIRIAKQKKDMISILHRFGAYLETLFAQINMRTVLEKFPFDPEND